MVKLPSMNTAANGKPQGAAKTGRRDKLLSQDSYIQRNESEIQLTLPTLKNFPDVQPNNATTIDFTKKKASINQLAFDPQSSVVNGVSPYQFSVIPGGVQAQFIERLHKSNPKLYEGAIGHQHTASKMPPYLAMKKMILEQQMRNNAIYSMPLVQTGAGKEMQLRGERLATVYNKGREQPGPQTQRTPGNNILNDSKASNANQERASPDLIIGLKIQQHSGTKKPINIRQTPYFSPQHISPERERFLGSVVEKDGHEQSKKKIQNWQGGITGYENCFNSQLSPLISRMRLQKPADQIDPSQPITQEESILEEGSPQITKRLKYSRKLVIVAQPGLNIFQRTDSFLPRNPLLRAPPKGTDPSQFIPERLIGKVNKTISMANEFINLTLKNKNSVNQNQAKRLLKRLA